jgi:CHAT domain-containing protein/Tfp pilus assembly protein PilF
LNSLGVVARTTGDLSAALDYYGRALRIRERLAPESSSVAATLNNLGTVAYDRGDLTAAESYHTRAFGIYERVAPDSSELATSLNNLGNIAWSRGTPDAAEEYYTRSLAIRERRAPDSLEVAASLNNLGNVAWARGEWASAQASYRRALSIRERLAPESLGVASSLNNLGNVASDRGDAAAAENYHLRALAIRERLAPGSLNVAISLNNLGHVASSRGDLTRAQEYHTRALALHQRLAPDSLNVAIGLNNLGDVAHSRGDPAAQDYYLRALALKERLAPDSLTVATTLNNLGRVAAGRGERSAARGFHTRALAIRERLAPESLAVAASRSELGRLALADGRASDALPLFTGAVDLIENQRWQVRSAEARALLLAKHTESYTGLVRTYMALGDVPSAFATAERARARSLLEIVTESGAEIREGVDGALLQRERLLQRQLNAAANRQSQILGSPHTAEQAAAARKELDALLVQYRQVLSEIRLTSPRYAALTQPQPIGVSEVQQQLLDDDTMLLEYALGEEAGYLFVLTPGSIRGVALPGRDEIERAARRVYDLLTARQPVPGETAVHRRARIETADADYPAAAAALSRMVLGPVAGQLAAARRLLIVADGALQYVPFAALPVPGGAAGGEAVPLIVLHEIVSLPSASVVAVLRRELEARPPAENLVAVVADPVFSEDDPRVNRALLTTRAAAVPAPLPAAVQQAVRDAGLVDDRGALSRLPFTRDEAAAIVALSPAGRSTRVIDFDANRATVTGAGLSRHRVVHLATHGVLDTEHPELSGLVLSLVDEKGTPQDGFLRLHEVYNLNWSADLVVLSACQTALGAEIRGEGLVGLTRGFMYAGAARVLASLWSINDGATAQFMKEFYEGLLVDALSPAAALREAQIEMFRRGQWRSPYYWAAFVLQGEWNQPTRSVASR